MRARSIISAAALAVAVRGQSATNSATTTSTAPPATTHTISVGAEGFKFTPSITPNASVGDILEFRLYPGGHAVARSNFTTPCLPYEYTGANRAGFFSGYIGPQIFTGDAPKFQVRVNDTKPIWIYCTAPGSCFQQHMIGVINPNANETFDLQQQYAINATFQLAPGDPIPSESLIPTHTPGATSDDEEKEHHHHGLSTGAIVGIAIGGAAALILVGAVVFLCGRRGGINMAYRRSTHQPPFAPTPMVDNHDSKYIPPNPKSPGQETYSTAHYSLPPVVNDPYRTGSPHAYASSPPPPITPQGHPAYGTYSSTGSHPNAQSPLMAGMAEGQGYYPGVTPPPAEIHSHQASHPPQPQPQPQQAAPVELPTSVDPGNSPLPGYKPGRQYSWHQGQETQYRPGNKAPDDSPTDRR
ncbi:hypothetical protein GE09DRAFT_421383 [Coniochaeta sp. 2T2.1]|nr:hypothetical protein GE09DRAFT_421383 [Coniochaeta sp. 2T2.1]